MKLSNKLVDLFGTNYIVRNKQVEKLISNEKTQVVNAYYQDKFEWYVITLNKTTKANGMERNISLHAKQLPNGIWRIQN